MHVLSDRKPAAANDPLARFEKYSVANWDGYGAEAITKETLDAAREFLILLPKDFGDPEIAPGSDGIIALEWLPETGPFRKLFIDIGPGPLWSAYYRRADGEKRTLPHRRIDGTTRGTLEDLFKDLSN